MSRYRLKLLSVAVSLTAFLALPVASSDSSGIDLEPSIETQSSPRIKDGTGPCPIDSAATCGGGGVSY